MSRRVIYAEGEHYHIFNRGVEKRDVFGDRYDIDRFLLSLRLLNTKEPIGSIYEQQFVQKKNGASDKLVDIVCYCLNPNHYHMILQQKAERGIQKFMQRLGTAYTNYFNEKYTRTGGLFQGTYKGVHIESNEQLLHTSVYVNLNNTLGRLTPKLSASSWGEYVEDGGIKPLCTKGVILEQLKSSDAYKTFALSSRESIIERKRQEKETQWLLGS